MTRILWADRLKGLLIVLVVLGHAIQETLGGDCFNNHLWNIIYSFHMPAFMAVSGFLNYRMGGGISNRLSIVYRRFQQLLIPFVLWTLIKILIYPPYRVSTFVNAFLYPDGTFWFLWVLFFISVFFYLGDWMGEKLRIKQEIVIIAMCIGFALLMVLADIRIGGFQFIAYYFLFYSLGYYLNKYKRVITSKYWVLGGLVIVWAMMAWFWNMHQIPFFLEPIPLPVSLMQYTYRFITAAIAVYVLFGVAPLFLNNDSKGAKPIVKLGRISLGIYTVHLILMPFIVRMVSGVTSSTLLTVVSSFIICLAFSWIIVYLLNKWTVTSRLLLGKINK